jgi:hypothetical protein
MLANFADFLNTLGNVDDGVECVLSDQARESLVNLAQDLFGLSIADLVHKSFSRTEDGTAWRVAVEGVGDQIVEILKATQH